jgi:hypothetical protein
MKKLISQFYQVRLGRLAGAVILAFSLAGCGDKEIQVYGVAKESSPATPSAPSFAANPQPQASLTWVMPAGWEEAPRGQVRLASFKIKGENTAQADVSVILLPGTAGGDLANVNRWRGQVGLAAVEAEELAKLTEKVAVGGSEGALFDLAGTGPSGDPTRVLATVLHQADMVWFLKMTGDDALVAKQKPLFLEFLKSVKLGAAGTAQSPAPAGHAPHGESSAELPHGHPPLAPATSELPQGHPPIGGLPATPETKAAGAAKPQWELPANWQEESATQMLIAKFSVGDKAARAEITVSSFPGEVGGLLANVNRWRGQIGLPPVEEAQLGQTVKNLKVQFAEASLVELGNPPATEAGCSGDHATKECCSKSNGTAPSLIGVAAAHKGQTWFFKMVGDAKTVASQKDAFVKFVQSVRLPNAS